MTWKRIMTEQSDLFSQPVLSLADRHRDRFPDDFLAWLPINLHVYGAFKREALAVRRRGFEHYSARTIIEFMRHHSAVYQKTTDGKEWKLNDHHTPYLARLFDLDCPESVGLFEYRETKKVFTQLVENSVFLRG